MSRIENRLIILPYSREKRILRIYLPDSYDDEYERDYPVVYMQDGQNVFLDKTAAYGRAWRAGEAADRIYEKTGAEVIIAAFDSSMTSRMDEYSPWRFNVSKYCDIDLSEHGGNGEQYADYFINTIKKMVEMEYRVDTRPESVAICGSSMGAMISAFIAAKYRYQFGYVGIFSLACWYAEQQFFDYIRMKTFESRQHYYIYVGTKESSYEDIDMSKIYLEDSKKYIDILMDNGINPEQIKYVEGNGAKHCEAAWDTEFEKFLLQFASSTLKEKITI